MVKQKFYVVPAEIIESNFPDDISSGNFLSGIAMIETEKTITEIAELLVKDEIF